MKLYRDVFLFSLLFIFGGSCATVTSPASPAELPVSQKFQSTAQKIQTLPQIKKYKMKLAIGRFTNETMYGRALLNDEDLERIGKQASDMLSSRLVKCDNFIVIERPDIKKISSEGSLSGEYRLNGVDTLIIGSVTEFGRSVTGQSGFFSSTKLQAARAKVEVRLVDVATGRAFFTVSGTGQASIEAGEVAGFGSQAGYDATLNDKAVSAAISDMIDGLISTLDERPWRSDILSVKGDEIIISGGKYQGLKVGDKLQVNLPGESFKSKQSGFDVTLPPTKAAELQVSSIFGDSEINEGSICTVTAGKVDPAIAVKYYVTESR